MNINVDKSAVKTAINNTLTLDKRRGWILLGYKPGSQTDVVVQSTKVDGTVEQLVQALNDNEVQYALIRLPDTKDGTETIRDVMIAWTGPSVKKIEASKKKTHIGTIKEVLQPFHADLEAISKENFTEEVVYDRSKPLSGSHVID